MTIPEKGSLSVFLTETEDGKIIAATNEAPYFCFEVDTKEELDPLIREAVELCLENRNVIPNTPASAHLDTFTPVWGRGRFNHLRLNPN